MEKLTRIKKQMFSIDDFFTLDVGCGDAPIGDVNTDLYIDDILGHRSDKQGNRYHINPKEIPNFVHCSALHLPFKDQCFDLVNSRQVYEHLPHAEQCAFEMVRCSKDLVVIETVHRRGERLVDRKRRIELNKVHVNKLDFNYFGQLAKVLGVYYVWSETLIFNYFIHFLDFQFFKVPFIIRIIYSRKHCDWCYFSNRKFDAKQWYLRNIGL